jgi:hypothetical protein
MRSNAVTELRRSGRITCQSYEEHLAPFLREIGAAAPDWPTLAAISPVIRPDLTGYELGHCMHAIYLEGKANDLHRVGRHLLSDRRQEVWLPAGRALLSNATRTGNQSHFQEVATRLLARLERVSGVSAEHALWCVADIGKWCVENDLREEGLAVLLAVHQHLPRASALKQPSLYASLRRGLGTASLFTRNYAGARSHYGQAVQAVAVRPEAWLGTLHWMVELASFEKKDNSALSAHASVWDELYEGVRLSSPMVTVGTVSRQTFVISKLMLAFSPAIQASRSKHEAALDVAYATVFHFASSVGQTMPRGTLLTRRLREVRDPIKRAAFLNLVRPSPDLQTAQLAIKLARKLIECAIEDKRRPT